MQAHLVKYLTALVVALSWSLAPPAAHADDTCYMVIFAHQGKPVVARTAHTFATFVKLPEDGDGKPDVSRLESHTISWIAATTKVVLLRRPEVGVNLDLAASMKLAKSMDAEVTAWGPYRIKKELYDRALAQIERLNSGAIAYKALDGRLRPDLASNCFHAVSDIVDGPQLNTGTAFGNAASEMVRDHLSRWIIDPGTTHPFLIGPLGLDKEAVVVRK